MRQAAASDMTLSKYLPRPTDLFSTSVGQRKLASGSNASGTTHKKRREDLDCFRTEHTPGQLPESLWAQLGARITSIATNHRPGVHGRSRMPAAGGSLPHSCRPLATPCHQRCLVTGVCCAMELWQYHAAIHLSPRMASGVSLPTPGVLRLAAAGVDMSLPTSGIQVSYIWRPLAPGNIIIRKEWYVRSSVHDRALLDSDLWRRSASLKQYTYMHVRAGAAIRTTHV